MAGQMFMLSTRDHTFLWLHGVDRGWVRTPYRYEVGFAARRLEQYVHLLLICVVLESPFGFSLVVLHSSEVGWKRIGAPDVTYVY